MTNPQDRPQDRTPGGNMTQVGERQQFADALEGGNPAQNPAAQAAPDQAQRNLDTDRQEAGSRRLQSQDREGQQLGADEDGDIVPPDSPELE